MEPSALADLATGVFGPDRVHVAERLDDAIERAVALADDAAALIGGAMAGLMTGEADLGSAAAGAAVLVTGSVITAGDARLLLTGSGQ